MSNDVLYGVDGFGNLPSSLYRINVGSGVATLIGLTGFNNVTALAFDTTTTTMYAVVSSTLTPFTGTLLTVNLQTGVATSIAAITSVPSGVNVEISDACFIGSQMYGWNEGGNGSTIPTDQIATINKASGTFTQTTTAAFVTVPAGIARSAVSGTLFVKSAQTVVRAFQTTGTTSLWSTITAPASGLEAGFCFNDSGVAYVIDRSGGDTNLLTINPLSSPTCVATTVGLTGVATLQSIEFGPSAPTVYALTGIYQLTAPGTPGELHDTVYSTVSVSGTSFTGTTTARTIPEPSVTFYGLGDE